MWSEDSEEQNDVEQNALGFRAARKGLEGPHALRILNLEKGFRFDPRFQVDERFLSDSDAENPADSSSGDAQARTQVQVPQGAHLQPLPLLYERDSSHGIQTWNARSTWIRTYDEEGPLQQ
jgi:hypothetical protein